MIEVHAYTEDLHGFFTVSRHVWETARNQRAVLSLDISLLQRQIEEAGGDVRSIHWIVRS